ncbi:Semaphorin-3A [Varanus komodoensis]|nr:Semaphorin-3A [Varanus komodoensis]
MDRPGIKQQHRQARGVVDKLIQNLPFIGPHPAHYLGQAPVQHSHCLTWIGGKREVELGIISVLIIPQPTPPDNLSQQFHIMGPQTKARRLDPAHHAHLSGPPHPTGFALTSNCLIGSCDDKNKRKTVQTPRNHQSTDDVQEKRNQVFVHQINLKFLVFHPAEMYESNNIVTFHGLANSSSYHTFLLDEERSKLYVGAKDHIFSFNLVNIKEYQKIVWPVSHTRRDECKWAGKDILKECANFIKVLKAYNQTHLYVCGTGAFHPVCTYIEVGGHPEDNIFKLEDSHFENGRGKSPYDPKLLTASLLIDGELYSGTAADFMGRDFAIFRTLGHHHPIRTEQHDSRWLNDPRFISAHLIPESDNPEDDKIYFFFRENAIDGEHSGKATHARIGQICKCSSRLFSGDPTLAPGPEKQNCEKEYWRIQPSHKELIWRVAQKQQLQSDCTWVHFRKFDHTTVGPRAMFLVPLMIMQPMEPFPLMQQNETANT